jgi:hypothetical protein
MTHKALIRRLEIICLGLDPIDPLRLLVDDVIAALAQPQRTEQNFCPRCGKRTNDIHTCTPPQRSESSGKSSAWVGLTDDEIDTWNIVGHESLREFVRAIEAKLKEKNT